MCNIKDQISLVDVASKYGIALQGRDPIFKAKCPFHEDKTPSLNINNEQGLYYCFGCQKGGDVISFIQEKEQVSFKEAIKILQEIFGVESDYEYNREYADLYKITNMIQSIYRHNQSDQRFERFIQDRGIHAQSQKYYRLGYAKKSSKIAYRILRENGYSDALQLLSGNFIQRSNGTIIDRFINRITFPILDEHGEYIAFSCRAIDDQKPKYLNSSNSPIFNKSKHLFGLYQALEAIKDMDYIIIVEGQIDVIAMYQSGIKNAVCALGTSFTLEHCDYIKRFTNNIVFCYDGDKAGRKATRKSCGIAMSQDMNVKIAVMPECKDPDDCSKEQLIDILKQSIDPILYLTNYNG